MVKFNEPSTGDTELNFRIDAAENKFYSNSKNFLKMKIHVMTRTKIFDSLVRRDCFVHARHGLQLLYDRAKRMLPLC